jgi:hypothetical protein
MKPIGLTTKSKGELAIVHECLKCGKLSLNRIAGDDNPYSILSLLDEPVQKRRITMLALEDREQVLIALFGYNHPDI